LKEDDAKAEIARAEEEYKRAVQQSDRAKGRIREAEVRLFVATNESLLENEDLDFLVSSSLLQRSTKLLAEMNKEIGAINQDEEYPLEDFQELISAFNRLDEFVKEAFAFHERRFGLPEDVEARRREAEDNMVQLRDRRAM
jgi:hypothetical protein